MAAVPEQMLIRVVPQTQGKTWAEPPQENDSERKTEAIAVGIFCVLKGAGPRDIYHIQVQGPVRSGEGLRCADHFVQPRVPIAE